MTSLSCQSGFHDVIYHVEPCNVDTRRCNVILQLKNVKNICKTRFHSKQELREILTFCSWWWNRYIPWRIGSYFPIFLCVRIEVDSLKSLSISLTQMMRVHHLASNETSKWSIVSKWLFIYCWNVRNANLFTLRPNGKNTCILGNPTLSTFTGEI